MEAIILCGIQATGKSTFCKERFFGSHIRLNLDMLKTRNREELLFRACLEARQPVVVDNTNPSRAERRRYIAPARSAGFRIIGYYFQSRASDSLMRNGNRPSREQVPERGLLGTSGRLELPSLSEGFDELYYVRITDVGFEVLEWRDEV